MKTLFASMLLLFIGIFNDGAQARYSYCQKPREACLRNSDCCLGVCQAQLRSYYGFCTDPQPSIPYGSTTHLQLLTLLRKLEDLRETNFVNRIDDHAVEDHHDDDHEKTDDEDHHDDVDDHHDHHHHHGHSHVLYHSH